MILIRVTILFESRQPFCPVIVSAKFFTDLL